MHRGREGDRQQRQDLPECWAQIDEKELIIMSFQKFESDAQVIDFARQHSSLFGPGDLLKVEEIGDGNINFVYRVYSDQASLIVKQALPYVRIIGEGWPLSQDRVRIEAETLQIEGKYCPDLVPEVYHFDAEQCAIVMEDIGAYRNLRHVLLERERLPLLSEHLGRFLADSLFFTSDLYLNTYEKKALVKRFINPDLCKISEELFFWDPYCDHERNAISDGLRPTAEALWQNNAVKLEVARLKAKFLNQAEALLHGDLHAGSVFANSDGTKVIDPEFAYVGPIGFDVGSIIGNYLLNVAGQANQAGDQSDRADYQQWLLNGICTLWQTFEQRFRHHMAEQTNDPSLQLPEYADWYLKQLLADSLGYAGTELIRRTVGLAHVMDIESIADENKRADSEILAVNLGEMLILERESFVSMTDVVDQIGVRIYCK